VVVQVFFVSVFSQRKKKRPAFAGLSCFRN
jgi:hypothetical protein